MMLSKKAQASRKHILIVGLPRSGTSILASLIGAHPHISICNEDFGKSWINIIGKPIVGNKLCVPRQIDWKRRRTSWIKLLNRFGIFKLWPKSHFSLQDYLSLPNLIIIGIRRNPKKVRQSIQNRDSITWKGMGKGTSEKSITKKTTQYTVDNGTEILDRLDKLDKSYFIQFEELISDTENILKGIFHFIDVEYKKGIVEQATKWNWVYPNVSKKGIDKSKV